MFSDIDQVKKYINVSRNLDIRLLEPYQEEALRKVHELIPSETIERLQSTTPKVFFLIEKAVANYMMGFAIPFLKIHISNTGGNHFEDGKSRKAEWWDLRDYGLSAVRIADKALSQAISQLKSQGEPLSIFSQISPIFSTPEDWEAIYPIHHSWDVLMKLQPLIQYAWNIKVSPRLTVCTLSEMVNNTKTASLLRSVIGYYTLADALREQQFVFTRSGVVLQWEELPWQRSSLLEANERQQLYHLYTEKANKTFITLIKVIEANPADFPCCQTKEKATWQAVERKSGLYF